MTHSFPLAALVFNLVRKRGPQRGHVLSFSSLVLHCRSCLVHVSRQVKGVSLKKAAIEKEAWMEIARGQGW